MLKRKIFSVVLVVGFLLSGCGDSTSTSSDNTIVMEDGFTYKAINNQGEGIETTLNEYTIKVLSNSEESSNPQSRHKGLVVRINGEKSKTLHIQNSYVGKEIAIAIYKDNQLVYTSNTITITDQAVTVIDVEI